MLGAVWLLQRRLTRGASKQRAHETIRVVAKRGVGGKAQVAVVEIDGARYVLGVAEGGISVIDRMPGPAASVTALPSVPRDDDSDDETPLTPPLPLRRSALRAQQTGARARTSGLGALLSRDTAQALRRALGA